MVWKAFRILFLHSLYIVILTANLFRCCQTSTPSQDSLGWDGSIEGRVSYLTFYPNFSSQTFLARPMTPTKQSVIFVNPVISSQASTVEGCQTWRAEEPCSFLWSCKSCSQRRQSRTSVMGFAFPKVLYYHRVQWDCSNILLLHICSICLPWSTRTTTGFSGQCWHTAHWCHGGPYPRTCSATPSFFWRRYNQETKIPRD